MICLTPSECINQAFSSPSHNPSSNGKIDKRALRTLALAKIEEDAERLEKKGLEDSTVKPEFYSQETFKGTPLGLAGLLPGIPIPPPAYQPDFQVVLSEKSSPSEGIPSSSSSDTIEVSSSSDLGEKGNSWDGHEDDILPEKTQGKLLRNIRHQVFSLYRRLFGVVFTVNMAVLVYTLVRGLVNAQHLGLIVVSNLFCAILMRQDYVINTFFTIFCAVPSS